MTIFDTDVLIWFLRGDSGAASFINSEPDRGISIVSLMELIQGTRSKAEVARIRAFVAAHEFNVLAINESISFIAATLIEEHAHGDGLQVADALIAATAKERGATLATGNIRHFRSLKGLLLKAFRPKAGRN
ncbi:MAG: type II toxin-antitoxin system VapC family toxin [Acidobacteriota bacterium]|nr:type II toxin-antitoxin system VapC family toxin [Acidobacteriota bacterium]